VGLNTNSETAVFIHTTMTINCSLFLVFFQVSAAGEICQLVTHLYRYIHRYTQMHECISKLSLTTSFNVLRWSHSFIWHLLVC